MFINTKIKVVLHALAAAIVSSILIAPAPSYASDRFPRPEFQDGYEIPVNDLGAARDVFLYYIDAAMLLAALCAATYFVFKKRSHKGVVGVMIFSIAYFGFFKRGCVCPLGSIQNIAAGLFTGQFVSITIFLTFALPLLFALFFGRIFCSGVCPMGALQDFAAIRAKKIPQKVTALLGFIPHVYLGVAVLFAATGAGFPICRFDPFVGIFRLSAPFWMMVFGAAILLVGVFVARPYCRFLCPYSVLLKCASAISKYRVKIYGKNKCINCRLCENACPVDAILPPAAEPIKEKRARSINRLKLYFALLPAWIIAFAISGWFIADFISQVHPDVKLHDVVVQDQSKPASARSFESEALRVDANVIAVLKDRADNAKNKFRVGMIFLGAYFGIVLGTYLIRQSIHKKRDGYDADVIECVTCARCYDHCPATRSPCSPDTR